MSSLTAEDVLLPIAIETALNDYGSAEYNAGYDSAREGLTETAKSEEQALRQAIAAALAAPEPAVVLQVTVEVRNGFLASHLDFPGGIDFDDAARCVESTISAYRKSLTKTVSQPAALGQEP